MVALIAAGIPTLPALVALFVSNRGRQHAKAAREQVENDHSTNLRDELDKRHGENVRRLRSLDEMAEWQVEHQKRSDKGYRRILRLELVLMPAALIAAALGFTNIRRTK